MGGIGSGRTGRPRKPVEEIRTSVTIQIAPETKERVRRIAELSERSVGGTIGQFVDRYLERLEDEVIAEVA